MTRTARRLTATGLITAAVVTNLGFAALSRAFGYPDVLAEPTAVVLSRFSDHRTVVVIWFSVLAGAAALLAPIAVGVGRLRPGRTMRWATGAGIGAGAVQAIGLARWPLLVPVFAHAAASADPAVVARAHARFHLAHVVLGTVIGETVGYLLTATWTLLLVAALGRRFAGPLFSAMGAGAALMIAGGALSPLGLGVVDLATFAGYILWSAWLVWLAISILRSGRTVMTRADTRRSFQACVNGKPARTSHH